MTEHNQLTSSPNTVSLNGTTTTITRSVPRCCEVCKGKAKRMPTCGVCEGKGWLYIWETETTYSTPYIQPYPQPYTPSYPPMYGQGQTKPVSFEGMQAINCLVGSHDH